MTTRRVGLRRRRSRARIPACYRPRKDSPPLVCAQAGSKLKTARGGSITISGKGVFFKPGPREAPGEKGYRVFDASDPPAPGSIPVTLPARAEAPGLTIYLDPRDLISAVLASAGRALSAGTDKS